MKDNKKVNKKVNKRLKEAKDFINKLFTELEKSNNIIDKLKKKG